MAAVVRSLYHRTEAARITEQEMFRWTRAVVVARRIAARWTTR